MCDICHHVLVFYPWPGISLWLHGLVLGNGYHKANCNLWQNGVLYTLKSLWVDVWFGQLVVYDMRYTRTASTVTILGAGAYVVLKTMRHD